MAIAKEQKRVTRFLSVKLTDDERDERRREATSLVAKYGEIEDEKKESAADFACLLKSTRKSLDRVASEANSGTTMRDVDCVETIEDGFRCITRIDTLETIEREPVKQAELFN